jgi:tape measure domain-containing protein
LSTLSQNNIVVNYVLNDDQVNKAKTAYDKLTDAEKKAVDEARKLNDQLKKTGQEGSESAKKVGNEMNNITSLAKSGAGLLAGFFAVSKIKAFGAEVLDATIKFDTLRKAINFTSGSMEVGSANFAFLTKIANELGISLDSASRGFKTISGAASQAGYTNKQVQDIFLNTSKAIAAFGLNADEANGVFQALSQIISKGVVSMEELRQQLGERLPGVLAIAAKSVGKTTQEFVKLVSSGKITEREFIIPFTNALGLMSEKAAGIDSAGKAVTRFKNAYDQLLISLGRSADEEVGVIGFITKRATNFFNYWAKSFETNLQKTENLVAEGYQSVINSDIAKNQEIEKADLILFKAKTERNLKLNQFELDSAKKRLETEKKLAESFIGVSRTKFNESIKNSESIAKEVSELEKVNAGLKGQVKGYDELIKGKTDTKKVTKELTDAELKALKEQYQARLKLLELEERIALIKAQIKFEDPLQLERESYAIKKKYTDLKIALDNEAAKSGIKEAKETAKVRQAEIELVATNVIRANNEEVKSIKDKRAEIEAEEKKLYDKRRANQEDQLNDQKKTDKELEKAEQDKADAIKAIDKKSADEKKNLKKELAEMDAELIQASIDLAAQTTNALFDLQSQYAANDFARKQKQFDEEIRLADGNVQKITEINEKRAAAEKEYREKEFRANQAQAVANVIFNTAPIIALYLAKVVTAPLAKIAAAAATIQIGFILAQPVPEFAEGTKGKAFKGKAIVGEKGTELVTTLSGKQYYTPPTATLAQFDEPVHITPNHLLGLNDKYLSSQYFNNSGKKDTSGMQIVTELSEIKRELRSMPVAAISLDEKGFMKKVRTPNRSTTILNNRFKN